MSKKTRTRKQKKGDSSTSGSGGKRTLKIPIYDPYSAPAPGVPFERRKKKDWINSAAELLAALPWVFVAAFVAMTARAQPQTPDFFSRLFNTHVTTSWDTDSLMIAFFMLSVSLVMCMGGFVFRAFRHRRKTDRYGLSLITAAVVSVVGMIIIGVTVF